MIRILFVCTDNKSRSVMAAEIFRDLMKKEQRSDIMCQSAGFAALQGEPVEEKTLKVLNEIGIVPEFSETRKISSEEIPIWDVFFTVSDTHAYIVEQAGASSEKIYVSSYVSDPFGGDIETYRACREKLMGEVRKFYDIIKYRLALML